MATDIIDGVQYTIRKTSISDKEQARVDRALDREVAKDAQRAAAKAQDTKRASDEAYLNAEADKFNVLTPQKQAERDRIQQMKTDADREWDSMGKGNAENKPPANIEEAKDTYSGQQPTEQSTSKVDSKSKPAKPEDTSTPANLQSVNTPPPVEITDVLKDFDWTSSTNKQQMAGKIPYIRLVEYKLTANNAINGFGAGLMAWADVHRSSVAGASKLGGAINKISQSNFIGKAATGAADAIGAAGAAVAPYLQQAENFVKSKANDSFGHEGQHLTDIYGMLYARSATGRTYTLPYYNKDFFHAGNDFSDSSEAAPPLVGGFFDAIQAAGAIPSLVEPGVYVQRPKFYQFASATEPSVSISLTLYNTLTPMSYLKHAKFIQQLALNNLPRRITRSVVEPPCIYEVFIPGKAFYPYCFIDRLQISNVGARRIINNEIVPDAFQIEISLTSLVKDASNFYERQMQHHGIGTPSVGGAGGSAGSFAGGGGDNMGASGAQRDAVASVDSGRGASMPISNSNSSTASNDPGANLDKNAAELDKIANECDGHAVRFEKAGNMQKAAEMRAIAASSRQDAAQQRGYAADVRDRFSKLP
jgi:hypothetical protein